VETSNFYVVCATVIPVLALAKIAAGPVRLDAVRDDVANERAKTLGWGFRFVWVITLAQWLVTGWAEFVCVRRLETGHVASGGPVVIWIALAATGAQIVAAELISPGWAINTGFRHFYHGVHGRHLDEPR